MAVYGSMGYSPQEAEEALRLISGRQTQRDALVTHTFPLDRVAEAFHAQGNADQAIKVLLVNGAN
jgi:threonine dehydrogenase-like Zn-dependent dehydrogenase